MENGIRTVENRSIERRTDTSTRLRRGNNEFSRHFIGEEVVGRFLERIDRQISMIKEHKAKVLSLAHLSDGEICDDDVDRLREDILHNRAELGGEVRGACDRGYLEDIVKRVDNGGSFAEIIRAAHEEGCINLLLNAVDNTGSYTKATSAAYQGGCLEELMVSDEHLKRAIKAVVEEGRPDLLNKMVLILGFERIREAANDGDQTVREAIALLLSLHNGK